MKRPEKVVSVRFADADYRKLQHTAERNGSNVAAELRAIVAERMRWNDQHAQISADLKATMEAVALAILPAIMERLQVQSDKGLRAQAPAKTTEANSESKRERDWSVPWSPSDTDAERITDRQCGESGGLL